MPIDLDKENTGGWLVNAVWEKFTAVCSTEFSMSQEKANRVMESMKDSFGFSYSESRLGSATVEGIEFEVIYRESHVLSIGRREGGGCEERTHKEIFLRQVETKIDALVVSPKADQSLSVLWKDSHSKCTIMHALMGIYGHG